MKKQAYMNTLTTKKQMQMKTWWALVGTRSKLRSKVKFFNFVPFSRLINLVRQRRKTETENFNKTNRKKFESCWFSIFKNYFVTINLTKAEIAYNSSGSD